jgi:hypothetical protein
VSARARAFVSYHRRYYQHNARITNNRHTQQLRHAPHIRNNVPVFFLFLRAQIRARARKPSSSALFAKERRRRESTFYIDAGAWVLGRTKEEEQKKKNVSSTTRKKCIRACVDFFSSSSSKYLA